MGTSISICVQDYETILSMGMGLGSNLIPKRYSLGMGTGVSTLVPYVRVLKLVAGNKFGSSSG